jgi:hypothetical protein
MRMENKETGDEEYVWRLKGIPLTVDNKEKMGFEEYKEMIKKFNGDAPEEAEEIFTLTKNFRIEKKGFDGIVTAPMNKRLRPVINKGVLIDEYKIVPFGWSDPYWCAQNNPNDCSCKHDLI